MYFFENEIFILEYVLYYSESISTKKFSIKNFCLWHFLPKKFLGQALTSRNGGVSAAAAGGAASSFGEPASMGKGTYKYDGSKEPQ